MASDAAIELAKSLTELVGRAGVSDEQKLDVIADRLDGFAQKRREAIVRECSVLASVMAGAVKGASARHHGMDISKAIKELTIPRDEIITMVTDTVEAVFREMMEDSEDGVTHDFARNMSQELGKRGLRVQWVTRVGQFGIRAKANDVTVEFEAGPVTPDEPE